MALALDRQAFIDILTEGKAQMGGGHAAGAGGAVGAAAGGTRQASGLRRRRRTEPGRGAARSWPALGYGPGKPLKVKVSVRNIAIYRDPAVILIDQLKKIYIDGELEPIDTTVWYGKVQRKDYSVSLNLTGRRRSMTPTST